jgi:hypothetical protein
MPHAGRRCSLRAGGLAYEVGGFSVSDGRMTIFFRMYDLEVS